MFKPELPVHEIVYKQGIKKLVKRVIHRPIKAYKSKGKTHTVIWFEQLQNQNWVLINKVKFPNKA